MIAGASPKHFITAEEYLVEVVSPSTHRTDEQEKRAAYFHLPSLRAYVLVDQQSIAATVWRRGDTGFLREDYAGRDAVIMLEEIDARLSLAEVYEDVTPEAA